MRQSSSVHQPQVYHHPHHHLNPDNKQQTKNRPRQTETSPDPLFQWVIASTVPLKKPFFSRVTSNRTSVSIWKTKVIFQINSNNNGSSNHRNNDISNDRNYSNTSFNIQQLQQQKLQHRNTRKNSSNKLRLPAQNNNRSL